MKNKLLKALSIVSLCLMLALGCVACNNENKQDSITSGSSTGQSSPDSSLNGDSTSGDSSEMPHEHSYTSVITEPTCTEQGYTTYTCHCNDTYKSNYVNATGHMHFQTVVV